MNVLYTPRCTFPDIVKEKYAVRHRAVRTAGFNTEMLAELAHITSRFGSEIIGNRDVASKHVGIMGHVLSINGHVILNSPVAVMITSNTDGEPARSSASLINPNMGFIWPDTCSAMDVALMIELAYNERRTPRPLQPREEMRALLHIQFAIHLLWIIEQREWPELDAYRRSLYQQYGLDPELIIPTKIPSDLCGELVAAGNVERARLYHLLATHRKFRTMHQQLFARLRVWRHE